MSSNLENKIGQIKKLLDQYKNLNESEKINEAIKIKKEIRTCKKIISDYQDLLENTDAHLSEASDEANILSEESFKFNMDQLNTIKTTLEVKENLTIDDKISLFLDYTKYSNMIKEYLEQKREMIIKYV